MTPLQLLGLIGIMIVVRLALSIKRLVPARRAAVAGPDTAIAGGGSPAGSPASAAGVLREYLDAFIVAGLVALFLITFIVRAFFIPSGSMEPTLLVHDVLLANEFEYRISNPHRGDIVVFPPPVPTTNDFIKRLIGAPGDTFEIADGVVIRNGIKLVEPYEAQKPAYALQIKNYNVYVDGVPLDPTQANIPPKSMWTSPDTIPKNCYFMMGDNRNNSEDSHIWGFAQLRGTFATGPEAGKAAGFTGHAFFVFWPLDRLRILR